MRHYQAYSNDDILNGVKQVKSMAGLLKILGLKPVGGNYANMKRKLQQIGANCDHWTGYAWNRDERLKDWSSYTRVSSVKSHLIKERGHQCQKCQGIEWNNEPIPLEVHHIDSDRTNNDYSNLELNCPNCHYQTKGFRNRLENPRTEKEEKQKAKSYSYSLCSCGNKKYRTSTNCRKCSDNLKLSDSNLSKIQWPDDGKLHWLIWNFSMKKVSRFLGISDVSIKKHCRKRKIKTPPLGYWQKLKVGLIIDYQV